MTRYFFDTRCPNLTIHDEEGILCDQPSQAVTLAKRALGELCRDGAVHHDEGLFTISVRNEQGAVTFKASMCLDTSLEAAARSPMPA